MSGNCWLAQSELLRSDWDELTQIKCYRGEELDEESEDTLTLLQNLELFGFLRL